MIAVRFRPSELPPKSLPVAPILTAIVEANNHNLLQQVLCKRSDGRNALMMAQKMAQVTYLEYIGNIYILGIFLNAQKVHRRFCTICFQE
jgi:hypothetical protein